MKFKKSFQKQQKLVKCICLSLILAVFQFAVIAQNDPFTRIKNIAAKEKKIVLTLEKTQISINNPNWRAIKKPPLKFDAFSLVDKNKKTIDPKGIVNLSNGKSMTNAAYIEALNNTEKALTASGYSLRNAGNEINASETVTKPEYLNGTLNFLPKSIGARVAYPDVKNILTPTFTVDNIVLKPASQYTPEEKKKLENISFIKNKNGNIVSQKIARINTSVPLQVSFIKPLFNMNTKVDKDINWGNPDVIQIGIKGTFTRTAAIYPFDPNNPDHCKSEFGVYGAGTIYGSMLGHNLALLKGSANIYAPADADRPMKIQTDLSVCGQSVFNYSEDFNQAYTYSKTFGKDFDESFDLVVPIVGPLEFSGKLGIKGVLGVDINARVEKTFASASVIPHAEIIAYGEAGLDIGSIAKAGIGCELTILSGNINLDGFVGLGAGGPPGPYQNSVVFAHKCDIGYDIKALDGSLYVFAEVCVPDWVPFCGGDCKKYTHTLYKHSGFNETGNFINDFDLIPISAQ